jgi:membrane protein implicated in regulation of membrane protease activity
LCSLVSFLAGTAHLHLHLPKGLHPHTGHGAGGKGSQASPINFGTVAAFLAWFGGVGYLLSRYSSIWAVLALGFALVSGLAGAAIVFWFLFKVLLKHDRDLDPADYEMVGVLGRLSSVVRENGTGEMIFSQNGVRRAASARSEDGRQIAKGVEVVVTRYERGIAYVRAWEEMSESKKEN